LDRRRGHSCGFRLELYGEPVVVYRRFYFWNLVGPFLSPFQKELAQQWPEVRQSQNYQAESEV
jgi:hypothetical protein